MSDTPPDELPEVAFYYPGWIWEPTDWIKNLLLFFDGVALLVPDYMKERPEQADPPLVSALKKHNLLHILEPEKLVDAAATERLATAMSAIIASGKLDGLSKEGTQFHELSMSRLGSYGNEGLARALLAALKAKGLARDSEDGVSIPMHPMVRIMILVLLSQILRPAGAKMNLDLLPATDRPELVNAMGELLTQSGGEASEGSVVAFDLETVGVDLGSFPIDEILDFRKEHHTEFREYARSVRQFSWELSLKSPKQRASSFEDRQARLSEMANELKRISRRAWRRPASFGLTLVGAAWALASDHPLAAVLGLAARLVRGAPKEKRPAGAFSYLFRARNRFGHYV